MATVLTQDEIDELLNALASGEEPEPLDESSEQDSNVRNYDFKTANKFPKEQMRTLHSVYDNFTQFLSTRWTGMIRATTEISVIAVEEQTFNEFVNSLSSPTILAILEQEPLEGSVLLEFSPEVAYCLINRLFGGSNDHVESNKQFTEIELSIIERIIRQMMTLINDAWSKIMPVRARLDRIETSPQFAQIVAMSETVAIITINIKIGQTEGLINFCIPHIALEPVSKLLHSRLLYERTSQKEKKPELQDALKTQVSKTNVSLSAIFNNTKATMGDILSLQVGDVVQLDHTVSESLQVNVGHIPKFKGIIGTHNSKYAIQVISIIGEEGQNV